MADPAKVQAYWNSRAGLGLAAGSQDVLGKQMDMAAIAKYVTDGMTLLDVGCGNGVTAIELARRSSVEVTGLDYADQMIKTAVAAVARQQLRGSVRFVVGDVMHLDIGETYDLVYSERMLINLPDWEAQKSAIVAILRLVKPGGAYVMCENSVEGLESINALRRQIGLPAISPPWHNRYLLDAEMANLNLSDATLETIEYYSSTFYLLSRVVNAWLAAREGKEPEYEAPLNQLGIMLPSIGQLGQSRIWVWRKTG